MVKGFSVVRVASPSKFVETKCYKIDEGVGVVVGRTPKGTWRRQSYLFERASFPSRSSVLSWLSGRNIHGPFNITEQDLSETRAFIRSAYEKLFGSGSYAEIPVSRSAKESKAKVDIGIKHADVMTAATHDRYVKAKKRLARKLGTTTHYGRTLKAMFKDKYGRSKKEVMA